MRTLLQDLRFGARLFLSSPGFTIVAVLTLAVGLAANTTVFGWVDGVLLRPFPGARDAHQLAVLEMTNESAPNGGRQISYPDYLDYRAGLRSLSGLAVYREEVFTLGEGTAALPVWGELVSGNYFDVFGIRPALGRVFTKEEDDSQAGAHPVAVISHSLWKGRFRGDPKAVGKNILVNRRELTIVGVAPEEFRGAMPGLVFQIWIPVTMGPAMGMLNERVLGSRGARDFYVLARIRPGGTLRESRVEAATYSRSLEAAYPETNRGVRAAILPVWEFHSGGPDLLLRPLRIVMAISLLVLLIVCANVANLLLARSVARRKEISIRLALGAGGGRLIRQLLTEALLLALAGALCGLLLTFWLSDLLPSQVPKINAPVALGFRVSGRILVFTGLLCGLSALVSGAAPALLGLRSRLSESLQEGGRSGSAGVHSHRTRGYLVVAEVALATLALIGAGLFSRSFHNAQSIYAGFDKERVVLARFYMAGSELTGDSLQQFCVRLRDRLRVLPGVTEVTYASGAPLGSGAGPYTEIQAEGYVPGPAESLSVNNDRVAAGYFGLMRIPILEGRDFLESDDAAGAPVVIVNQTFARRYFAGASPVGRRVRFFGKWATVVGMVRDSKYFNVTEAPRPHFFVPFRQRPGGVRQLYVFVKTAGSVASVAPALRREAVASDPNAAAFDVMPLSEWTEVTMLPQKVAARLLGALGTIALLLAAVGLYSVMAYAVSQRRQEIGIRMALGAQPRTVMLDVLWSGVKMALAGLAIGIAISLAGTRLLVSLLVDVSATDPATFAGAGLFLTAVALVASYVPAWRATKVDPIVALRCE